MIGGTLRLVLGVVSWLTVGCGQNEVWRIVLRLLLLCVLGIVRG
jgi:hypothetical protein